MKIYKTTDPNILNLVTRLLKLIEMIDADPKLLFGTLFYSLLLLVYLVGTLWLIKIISTLKYLTA